MSDLAQSPNAPVPEQLGRKLIRELIRVSGLARTLLAPHFEQFGLTGAQFGVLQALKRAGEQGAVQSVLGESLLVSGPNITGLIDRLEDAGLVIRRKATGDRRKNVVSLSQAGVRLLDRVQALHGPRIARLLSGLDLEQQSELMELLKFLAGDWEQRIGAGFDVTRPEDDTPERECREIFRSVS